MKIKGFNLYGLFCNEQVRLHNKKVKKAAKKNPNKFISKLSLSFIV